MKNLFVPYEIAKQLKEKGFKEECIATYFGEKFEEKNCVGYVINKDGIDNIITAPLYQQVIDWFREKHKIYIWLGLDDFWNDDKKEFVETECAFIKKIDSNRRSSISDLPTYELLDDVIKQAIELI